MTQRRDLFPLAASIGATLAMPHLARAQGARVFNRGNGAEPQTLDPQRSTGVPESGLQQDLFEGLTTNAPDGSPVPGMAERWTVSEDGLVWRFTIRGNAKWSNGDPVTSEDFVYSLRRGVDPATASRFAWLSKPIRNADAITRGTMKPEELGVEAPDARTLVVTLDTPTPFFLDLLKHSHLKPVHRASVEQHGNQFTRPGNLVSNGPYMLQEWVPQGHIRLVKNPHHHDAANVRIETAMWYPTTDRAAEVNRYRAGELDWTYELPTDQVASLRRSMADHFYIAPWFGTYYLTLNNQRPPMNDPRVRRALSLAIQRDAIVNSITNAGETPAFSWVPPGGSDGQVAYQQQLPDYATWDAGRRVAEAKQLVTAAGFGPRNKLKLEFLFNTNDTHRRIGIALAAMWGEAFGEDAVEVALRNVEWQVYLDSTARAEYQMARAGWIGTAHRDASYFLEKWKGDAGEANSARYQSAAYDRALEAAGREPDNAKRQGHLQAAEAELVKDTAIIPIYFYSKTRLVRPQLSGYQPNASDVHQTRWMRFS